jgi:hypothetical protein
MFSATGLLSNKDFEKWKQQGRCFLETHNRHQWQVGDWLAEGEKNFGKCAYAEAAFLTGYKRGHLRDIAWVSSNVPLSVRTDTLTWSHHRQIAHLKPEEQMEWLTKAVAEELTVQQLRELAKQPRKKKEKQPKQHKLVLRLLAADLEWLAWKAKVNGVSPENFLRNLVRKLRADAQGLEEAAR